ncbi:Uncharacterised protein [Porphyromonas macacae]|uniref:RiboL-PSP-HEPN domain-containing protein n=1 Tax=Porphyromonas macacae TaxID=28115 RepID=A0A379EA54_9PORP|nr:hypothetical protein [Porphyromonas macacae]SUB89555.1 Uncharacterised protein [Porphyromonas macacae]
MHHNIHADFILAPIQEILADGINACKGIGNGIETQPLSEYILSSLFLKATGAQEQKLKCICWEIATHDYDFRYKFISGKTQLGECSDYTSKNKIYSFLVQQIGKLGKKEDIIEDATRKKVISEAISKTKALFESTNVLDWGKRDFISYETNISSRLTDGQILINNQQSGSKLFESVLQKDYDEIVYGHRNRLAHNTTSYQRHLPKLETIADEKYSLHNYFYRYTLLILIDLIFIHLYQEYRDSLGDYSAHL